MHVLLEIVGDFASSAIQLVDDMDEGFQTRLCVGLLHEFFHQFHTGENDTLTGTGDMWEETMLNGIILGGVRWIMGYANFHSHLISQLLQILLEQVVPGTIAATTVTQNQDRSGMRVVVASISVPPVAEAVTGKLTGVMACAKLDVAHVALQVVECVGDDATLGKAVEIMVVGFQFVQGVEMSFPIEIAQELLLLSIHAKDRVTSSFIGSPQPGDVLKLLISMSHRLHGDFLLCLASPVAILLEQLAHHEGADSNAMLFLKGLSYLFGSQVRPEHIGMSPAV